MAEPPGPDPSFDHGGLAFDPADPLVSADYAGWWRRTLAVIGVAWPLLLMLQALGAVVSFLCGVALSRWEQPSLPDQVQVADVGIQIVAQAVATVVDVVTFTLVTLAVVHVVVLTAAGRRPTLGACLRGAVRRLLPLIGWSLLAAVMISIGLLLCMLPGLYFVVVLLLLAPVIALERGQGIGRCFDLFHAGRGAAVSRNGTILVLIFAGVAIGSLLQLPITMAVGSAQVDPGTGAGIWAPAIGSVVTAAIGMLTGPLTVTAYADLRARREPTSTATLADQLLRP